MCAGCASARMRTSKVSGAVSGSLAFRGVSTGPIPAETNFLRGREPAPLPRRDIAPEDFGLDPIEEHEEAGTRRYLLNHVNGTPEQEPGRPRLAQQPALSYLDLRESLAPAQVWLGSGLGSGLELGSGSGLGWGEDWD